MATCVLVPGAWLGGWCWKYVAPALRERGHDVYTPTLTGLGEREHLGGPEVDLDTHVTDVVNVLAYEDLSDVILVGHSYAGLVVTGVLDAAAERIGRVVYLDGMFPMGEDTTSMFDTAGPEYRQFVEAEAAATGDGWRVPMPEEPDGWVDIDEADAEWVRSKAVPQPIETFAQGAAAPTPAARELPATYVLCTRNGMDDALLEMIRGLVADRDWDLVELTTGHWPMVSDPHAVVEIIDDVAAGEVPAG